MIELLEYFLGGFYTVIIYLFLFVVVCFVLYIVVRVFFMAFFRSLSDFLKKGD